MSLREDMALLRAYRNAGLEENYWRGNACLWPQSRAWDAINRIEATPDVTRMGFAEELRVRGD